MKGSLVGHQDGGRCPKKFSPKSNEHRLEGGALAQGMMGG